MATATRAGRAAPLIVGVGAGLGAVLVLVLVVFVVASVELQTVHVLGASMSPTLNADDYALARKTHGTPLKRGDVVIFRDPYDPTKDFIKRVIALPGERLRIAAGVVYVNGSALPEPYLRGERWTVRNSWPEGGGSFVMPRDSYFVMGDNRNHSSDSTLYGPVPAHDVEAVVFERIWPRSGPVR
jgi:signal peptidase I